MTTVRPAVAAALLAVATTLATTLASAAPAYASATTFCGDLGGAWDGAYCRTVVVSPRQAVRDIKVALPQDIIDDPVAGPVVRSYLSELVGNWRRVGQTMVADSWGEANVEVFRRTNTVSVVFRETYHADGPDFNNAYRAFTFGNGRRLELADVVRDGVDPLAAIAESAAPFVVQALDAAAPQHHPGTYPFVLDRWSPDKVYSGGYRAWALTPDELILYLPDYPVGHDTPLDFTPGIMQWSMDGGTVQAHVPLTALAAVLRPEFA
ncbi:mannan-binding protein [Mycolicibacterium mengxianglii]|uniref:mannan-binding protein n=1 Tax=Mycolicibacterium mengxianglii TaxID=2736649 RepID=UPI0018EF01B7|nr:mannan-binding family protein [Mycolicibacterium mengxianglii]